MYKTNEEKKIEKFLEQNLFVTSKWYFTICHHCWDRHSKPGPNRLD
jgi:hypothetical protein